MEFGHGSRSCSSSISSGSGGVILCGEEDADLRRGPWTVEEDMLLVNYVTNHGEGRWNYLAGSAGLKRTGKSCRLRWLNYLRPDVRRGNITPEEQLLILQLHARWGNRWSKIAQQLPGRTDNEIKNYWRTRVQKQARHLRCDVGSQQFRDVVQNLWVPRLLERIHANSSAATSAADIAATTTNSSSAVEYEYSSTPVTLSPSTADNGSTSTASVDDLSSSGFTGFFAEVDGDTLPSPSGLFPGFIDQSLWGEMCWSVDDDIWSLEQPQL